MGHERVGRLPRTKRWQAIVAQIAECTDTPDQVAQIAADTITNVRDRLRHLDGDSGVNAAFGCLVELAYALGSAPACDLTRFGIPMGEPPTARAIARAVREAVETCADSLEYAELAMASAMDAIAQWQRTPETEQQTLFDVDEDSWAVWQRAGTPGGFCELSRLFFARLTSRYLHYFLDREAAAALPDLWSLQRFDVALDAHVDDVSQHSFETARIAQSFAAGWFTNHTREGAPSGREVRDFLSIVFGKLREELRREGVRDEQ